MSYEDGIVNISVFMNSVTTASIPNDPLKKLQFFIKFRKDIEKRINANQRIINDLEDKINSGDVGSIAYDEPRQKHKNYGVSPSLSGQMAFYEDLNSKGQSILDIIDKCLAELSERDVDLITNKNYLEYGLGKNEFYKILKKIKLLISGIIVTLE